MPICSLNDIEVLETVPLTDRDLPPSTYDALKMQALRSPNAPALRFFLDAQKFKETHDWTYQQLLGDITRTANAFNSLGVGPDDVIAFMLPNLPETHFTIWGGEAAGIVMAVNPMLEATQIGDLIQAAKAKVVVCLAPTPGSDLWPKLASQLPRLDSLQHIVWVNMAPYVGRFKRLALRWMALRQARAVRSPPIHDLRDLMKRQSSDALDSMRIFRAEERSSYFCTGGTTGLPKIAVRTHSAEVFNAWAMAANLQPRHRSQIIFCGLPLFHVNGQLVTGLMPWTQGDLVILSTPQGYRGNGVIAHFWQMVEFFGINFLSGVPTVYSGLLQYSVGAADISSLQYALCGAAPMPADLFREFEALSGVKLLEGYGLTEGACVSSCNPAGGDRRVGSVGLRLPYQRMRTVIIDEQGRFQRFALVDEVGAIAINGPNVFDGYLSDQHNAGVWLEIDGQRWLNTGDLGRQDADGYFWLTGRKKELIIRGGHNIDPRQIEEALQSHPEVALVAAVGCPDPHAGEIPVAYVQLIPGAHCDSAQLLAFCAKHVSERAAMPKRIEIIENLPLTPVGKIFKPALQQLEIAGVIRRVAAQAKLTDVNVEVVQDARRGLVAKIRAGQGQTQLAALLGHYAFQIEWAA